MLSLMFILLTSCKKDEDFTNPNNLSGTSWLSENIGTELQPDYLMLKFTSTSAVELWSKYFGDKTFTLEDKGAYTISGTTITIILVDSGTGNGIIGGKTMTFEGSTFTKQ